MKAIVLSYDVNQGFSELTYKMYKAWENCPLIFRIPWNKSRPSYFEGRANVELIQCKEDIHSTMKALLKGIDDEEWVFWCIDDRFPKEINAEKLNALYAYVNTNPDFDSIKLFRWQERLKDVHEVLGMRYFFQELSHPKDIAYGYWHHQFCRAKYLRKLFSKEDIHTIWKFNKDLLSDGSFKDFKILVPFENIITFGEPCIGGKITPEAIEYLKRYNCPIPELELATRNVNFRKENAIPWKHD